MRAPLSWIKDYVALPDTLTIDELTDRLTALGLKLEAIHRADITGPLVVGRVLTMDPEPQKNGKTINWCTVDVGDANGTGEPQGIVCGAHNFKPGDLVVVILPGGVLPGDFVISARKTYGHVSAGMICSGRELGISDDHDGIIVLPTDAGVPGQDALPILGLDEEVIEFEINPDRAYAMSLRGVAREAALGFQVPFTDPALRDTPAGNGEGHPVSVEDPIGCPVFVTRSVTGFDPSAPTPTWMVRRLEQVGQRSISLAVDITNYVMFELGRPIHAYDADKLQGELVIRRAVGGESLKTLDGNVRALSEEDLVVTDASGIIGLGGVMGGESTEISDSTVNVLVEAAHWDATAMFRTGRRHKLTSEAGKRNERGVDPEICEAAADRVVELLVAHGGGSAGRGVTVVGQAPATAEIELEAALPQLISGMPISAEMTNAILQQVGCTTTSAGDRLKVWPPSWRPDLTDPYDLVEEVVRVVGYDDVPSVLPPAPAGLGLTQEQQWRRRLGRLLASTGHVEVISFPFVGTTDLDNLMLADDDPRRTTLRLANPLSSEEPLLATTLLPGLLKTAARNVSRGLEDLALFEIAQVAKGDRMGPTPILGVDQRPSEEELAGLTEAVPAQPLHAAVVLCGNEDRAGWWGSGRPANWSDGIEAMRMLADSLGLELEIAAADLAPWHPGRCAELRLAGEVVGHAGELHPRVCRNFGIPPRSVAAEIDASALEATAVAVPQAEVFSTYPVAKEDVALVVADSVTSAEVSSALREGAGPMCESIRLFDVYVGDQIEAGFKSLAFSLRFRAPDRTLTDAECAAARDSAVAVAVERLGARQRA